MFIQMNDSFDAVRTRLSSALLSHGTRPLGTESGGHAVTITANQPNSDVGPGCLATA